MKKIFISWLILLTVAGSAWALDESGALDISVRDLSGKPIAEATVYAIYSERVGGRVPRFKTDSKGKLVLRNLRPGNYEIHAFKESEGYPDTFFSFFATNNKKAWRVVDVYASCTTRVTLEIGPKYAILKLEIRNEQGNLIDASLTFRRVDDPKHPFSTGVNGVSERLVPPIPFRFEVVADGYRVWRSDVLQPRSGDVLKKTAVLRKSG